MEKNLIQMIDGIMDKPHLIWAISTSTLSILWFFLICVTYICAHPNSRIRPLDSRGVSTRQNIHMNSQYPKRHLNDLPLKSRRFFKISSFCAGLFDPSRILTYWPPGDIKPDISKVIENLYCNHAK